MAVANKPNNIVTWAQVSNVVPIVFTMVSVTLSVALFWYQIKLEINEVKGEVKLTNQKLEQVITLLESDSENIEKNSGAISELATRVTKLETEYSISIRR